jgi:hypothetical protein
MSENENDSKLAKAEAKAAKAKAKALRPWFKKKRFIVPIALVVVIALSQAVTGGGSEKGTETEDNSSIETPTNQRAGLGDAVVDGKFSFTVIDVECGIQSVGSEMFGSEAQGQFCKVSLNIENVGDEPQTMFADNQKIYDVEGREFSPDTSAMIYMEGGSDAWIEEINPGNQLAGELLFDVPEGATLDYIELHDSAFSSGVEVSLN